MNATINPREILLENILLAFQGESFSKKLASHIVGGRAKLKKLIVEGKIEVRKEEGKGKWHCDAPQVLRHCRDMRKGTKRKGKL